MTYQNIGYWIGQANDTSTGRHPTGWTNGQRWLETAPEWMTMYDAKETERAAWQAAYNDMVVQKDYWVGQYNAMTANRDYWQHTVAHNDPNVWTNQYNAGHSAGYNAAVAAVGVGGEYWTIINPNGTPPGYGGPYEIGRISLPGPGTAGEFMVGWRLHLNGQWEEGGGNAVLNITVNGPGGIGRTRQLTSGFAGTSGNINVQSGDGEVWHITATGGQLVIAYLDSWQCEQTNYNAVLAAHRIWNTSYPH